MKKLVIIILTFVLLISLVSCKSKTQNNTGNTGNTIKPSATPSPSITPDSKITPNPDIANTKEFPYLPAYSGMELKDITQPDQNNFRTANYIIKNSTKDKFLTEYIDILKKDGWTINISLKDGNPDNATAYKGNHMATIIPFEVNNTIGLGIVSR